MLTSENVIDQAPLQQPEYAQPADYEKAMYLIGGSLVRLAIVQALSTLPAEQYATRKRLADCVDELQGPRPGWQFDRHPHRVLFEHCNTGLKKAGLVEFSAIDNGRGRRAKGVRLSQRGRTVGPVIAGALFTPEFNPPGGPYLSQVIGWPRDKGRIPPRLVVYEELLNSSSGMATTKELHKKAGGSFGSFALIIQELCNIGLLERVGKRDPLLRTFELGYQELRAAPNTHFETGRVVGVVKDLRAKGVKRVTGADIVQAATVAYPGLSPKDVWDVFLPWFCNQKQNGFVTEVPPAEQASQFGYIRIAEKHRQYLTELLRVRDLLKDSGPDADLYHTMARERATKIVTSPNVMSYMLATAKKSSRFAESHHKPDWALDIDRYVPLEGITTQALHRVVTEVLGRSMTYTSFRTRLNSLPFLEITQKTELGHSGTPIGVITCQTHSFPDNWEDRALCLNEDPELFFPAGTTGAAVKQANEAKKVCKHCLVKLACLRDAIDKGIGYGIRGGLWIDQGEFTPSERERIERRVQIKRKSAIHYPSRRARR